MAKIGTMRLTGASGTVYDFNMYAADADWIEDLACVYCVSKRTPKPEGGGTHAYIYIGETGDMATRHVDHHKQACFERHGYNVISIHREANAQARLRSGSGQGFGSTL